MYYFIKIDCGNSGLTQGIRVAEKKNPCWQALKANPKTLCSEIYKASNILTYC